jgi:hypothetical protein
VHEPTHLTDDQHRETRGLMHAQAAACAYAGTDARTRVSLPVSVARIKFATASVVYGARRTPPKCVFTHYKHDV